MNNWEIVFSNSSEIFIKKLKLKDIIARILKKIKELENGPFTLPYKKIAGVDNMYRIRIGNYRVTYEVDNENRKIMILEIGHRQNIYD